MKMIEMHAGSPAAVLLVEDNDAHAELVIRSFEDNFMANQITHVSDGQEALDYLNRENEYSALDYQTPDLMLLDLRLPKVDGLEVLRQVRASKRLNPLPIIILTTSSSEIDLVKAYGLHVNSYLVKPFGFNEFSQLIGSLGKYWLLCNQMPEHVIDND